MLKNGLETLSSHALVLRIIGIVAACGLLLAIPLTAQFFQRLAIVYPPLNACSLLTETTAKTLLGDKVINRQSAPEINTDTNVATSKCSYSDMNDNNMSVVAVAVQTGINDKGVKKVTDDFNANKKANSTEDIKDIGKAAFFLPASGQLHVRDDRHWYIFNRSSGDNPTNSSKEQVIDFAKSVLKDAKA